MKSLLRELRPLLIYLIIGTLFTLLMLLATGKRETVGNGPGYWDEQDQMHQGLDQMELDSTTR